MPSTVRTRPADSGRKQISVSLPAELERNIIRFTKSHRTTVSRFAREALEKYLKEQLKTARHTELAETAKSLTEINEQVRKDWEITETERWPE